MNEMKHPGQAADPKTDADGLVCSPEFTSGCADPMKGMPPKLAPGAPVPEVQPRPEPVAADAGAAPMPVSTHNASKTPEQGFPEIACSPEFPKGCMNPSDET